MRVLQLGAFPPPHGGVQTNLVAIRDYLRNRGIPCGVINLTRPLRTSADDVYYPSTGAGVLYLLLRLPADILHLHIGGNLTTRLLLLSLTCCVLPWKKVVLTFHSGGFPSSQRGQTLHAKTLAGFALRRFDAVVVVNAEIVNFMARLGVGPDRTYLIAPHPAKLTPASKLPPDIEMFYRGHNPVLLTVCSIEPEYDLPLQIEVLGAVRRRWPGAGLAIVGGGRLEADLRAKTALLPWADHVLVAGDLPHPTTLGAIEQATVFLRTTWYDGDAISVHEALQLGTPVIATDNGMRPAGVRLIPVHDAPALEQAILAELESKRPPGASAVETPSKDPGEAVLRIYEKLLGSGK